MNTIIENLLPYGNFTITVLSLILTLVILTLIYQVGIIGIKHLLAFDTEDAPEFKMENKILLLLVKVVPFITYQEVYKTKVERLFGGWGVVKKEYHTGNKSYYDTEGVDNWLSESSINIKARCVLDSKEAALKVSKDKWSTKKELHLDQLYCVGMLLSLMLIDVIIALLAFNLFYTSLVLSIVAMYYGIRTLSKKVWSNTKRISVSEEKITKLEGERVDETV